MTPEQYNARHGKRETIMTANANVFTDEQAARAAALLEARRILGRRPGIMAEPDGIEFEELFPVATFILGGTTDTESVKGDRANRAAMLEELAAVTEDRDNLVDLVEKAERRIEMLEKRINEGEPPTSAFLAALEGRVMKHINGGSWGDVRENVCENVREVFVEAREQALERARQAKAHG